MFKLGDKVRFKNKTLGMASFTEVVRELNGVVGYITELRGRADGSSENDFIGVCKTYHYKINPYKDIHYKFKPEELELIEEKNMNMPTPSKALQFIKNQFLPAGEKLLRKYGFLNESGNLTPDYYEAILDCEARKRGYKSIEKMREYFNRENNVSLLELDLLVKEHAETVIKGLEELEKEEKEKK